jgi:hypothetical protein
MDPTEGVDWTGPTEAQWRPLVDTASGYMMGNIRPVQYTSNKTEADFI